MKKDQEILDLKEKIDKLEEEAPIEESIPERAPEAAKLEEESEIEEPEYSQPSETDDIDPARLIVYGVPNKSLEPSLLMHFSKYGRVAQIEFTQTDDYVHPETGEPLLIGIVVFYNKKDAEKATREKQVIEGLELDVEIYNEEEADSAPESEDGYEEDGFDI